MGKENKHYELECLNVLFDKNVVKGDFAQQMHRLLLGEEENFKEFEKPDFILECEDGGVVGLEHCLVDVMFATKHKKAQSMVRMQDGEIHRKIDEYNSNPEKKEKELGDGTAMQWVIDKVNERFKRLENFSYPEFIANFRKVCEEHNSRCGNYRENLKKYKQVTLACLVEIPYIEEAKGYIVIDRNLKARKQIITGIPITYDIVDILRSMTGFDFIIICTYSIEKPKSRTHRKIYYFIPKNVMTGIKQQGINLYQSFRYNLSAKLISTKVEREESNFNITYEWKPK